MKIFSPRGSSLAALLFVTASAISHGASLASSLSIFDAFAVDVVVEEASSIVTTTSPQWWLNSGGYFRSSGGVAATNLGSLPAADRWRLAYAVANPLDTDGGYRPQNLFRLLTVGRFIELEQSVRFRIVATNLSSSPNRDGYSGILLFSRYVDADNLYYAGLRHDGTAVIKRKRYGSYTTLASGSVYPGSYDRLARPNLLPQNRWIGLRTVTKTESDGSVTVRLEAEDESLGAGWVPLLEAHDTASSRITAAGSAGIRSDFMDVELDDYLAAEPGTFPASWADEFDPAAALEEANAADASADPNWWVSSGGRLLRDGLGHTLQGVLPIGDRWRLAYAASNPIDTEVGTRPQNVFRMLSRRRWENVSTQVELDIRATNVTDSPNRAAYSGVSLFARFLDENNLYVATLRHDGGAVIKRKRSGAYATLAYRSLYPGVYDRFARPNLLPQGRPIGMRFAAETVDATVALRLEVNDPALGAGWTPVLQASDTSSAAILAAGTVGIRSDFMDADFDHFVVDSGDAGVDATPTATPTATKTPTPAPTVAPTTVPTAPPPTQTPTRTMTPVPTATSTPTRTTTPPPTSTPTRTVTPLPTATRTPTLAPTATPLLCNAALSPTSKTFSWLGGQSTITVDVAAGCAWSVTGKPLWVTIVSGASGVGKGTVTYKVGQSARISRSGTIGVANRSFKVLQSKR